MRFFVFYREDNMPTKFHIAIAGQVVGVSALHETTQEFCRDYLTEEDADFSVAVKPEDIRIEREKSDREAIIEGHEPVAYSDEYLETLSVYRKIAQGLLNYNTILFHGSVIAVDGEGYLFTAKSGTGKSTHTRLWREYFGDRAVMINDDKPLLKITDQVVTVYGTPWDGKHHLSTNTSVPLKAICILERSEANRIAPVTAKEVFPMLCQQCYRPLSPAAMLKTLSMIDRLSHSVALYRLGCNMEQEAANIAYEGMNR